MYSTYSLGSNVVLEDNFYSSEKNKYCIYLSEKKCVLYMVHRLYHATFYAVN